jgi:hypothetical protein
LLTFFNAARIKTFQPELPEIAGKHGFPCFYTFGDSLLISFFLSTGPKGKAPLKAAKKSSKEQDKVLELCLPPTRALSSIFCRIPKMWAKPFCPRNHRPMRLP